LSVDLAHQLSFYLDLPVLQIIYSSQIQYLLAIKSCKHKAIFNYYWHDKVKFN